MDLDKIKDKWQSAEVTASIDESKIQHMLSNQGKGAYNYLVNYEKIGFIVSLVALAATIVVTILKPSIVTVFLASSIAVIVIWQLYKLYFLKQISISGMNVLQVSRKVNMYKLYISREWFFAIAWTLFVCILFLYDDIDFLYKINYENVTSFYTQLIIKYFILLSIIIGISYLIYRLTVFRSIKKLEASIQEVKEFEDDNNIKSQSNITDL